MELTSLHKLLETGCKIQYNEPLSMHTSFRIGGNAQYMAFPHSQAALCTLLKESAMLDINPYILGAGTNVLAPDEGLSGLVICLKDCLDGIKQIDNNRIEVMAGVTMTRAAVFAANLGLSGLEFAHGIPGTVGGGIYMNAGAYGGEISQVCEYVEVFDRNGNLHTLTNSELDFSYRHSALENSPFVVLRAVFKLNPGSTESIRSTMKDLMARRSASQPLDLPSAGSAFKRPKNGYAAALIEEAGLKGYTIGGASVSEKHAGFIVNRGNATSKDVTQLLQYVSDAVYRKFHVRLEPEVRIW